MYLQIVMRCEELVVLARRFLIDEVTTSSDLWSGESVKHRVEVLMTVRFLKSEIGVSRWWSSANEKCTNSGQFANELISFILPILHSTQNVYL